jgi:hypothetical protein
MPCNARIRELLWHGDPKRDHVTGSSLTEISMTYLSATLGYVVECIEGAFAAPRAHFSMNPRIVEGTECQPSASQRMLVSTAATPTPSPRPRPAHARTKSDQPRRA